MALLVRLLHLVKFLLLLLHQKTATKNERGHQTGNTGGTYERCGNLSAVDCGDDRTAMAAKPIVSPRI